jgi:hypothetical protein
MPDCRTFADFQKPQMESRVSQSDTATGYLEPGKLLKRAIHQFGRLWTSMRFHPNSRASTDQAPGPNRARAPPVAAKRMPANGSTRRVMVLKIPRSATSDPAIGVHKPATRRLPPTMAIPAGSNVPVPGSILSQLNARMKRTIPAVSRSSSRPKPGPPGANVENSRRRGVPSPGSRNPEA